MPFTLPVTIIIVLGTAQSERTPGYGEILVAERPAQRERAFALAARADDGTPWRADLPPAQSETLAKLLDRLPVEGMSAPTMSFDGVAYQVNIVQAGASIAFSWSNEDWRYAYGGSQSGWEAVTALAEYVVELQRSTSPPAPLQILERGV